MICIPHQISSGWSN